jgi:transcriptional regulator with PAS, ATPase and Fis domain
MEQITEGIVGKSAAIRKVIDLTRKVAPTDSTILITGETGTGKELIARFIHHLSSRSDKPFVALNCGAIPETLLESELFGHKKGAFTDASSDKKGLFEEANDGTFFLDEIGELSLFTQVKLLRVIENQEIRPVGSNETKKINVRIIAATNKDLVEAVKDGRFREDLFFRINVIQVHIPPLRERKEDIPLLTAYFLHKYNRQLKKKVTDISEEAMTMLLNYNYPGNVRELENIVQHAIVVAEGSMFSKNELPSFVPAMQYLPEPIELIFKTMEEMEEELIRETLIKCHNNQSLAAKKLHIGRTTLIRKMKKYSIVSK